MANELSSSIGDSGLIARRYVIAGIAFRGTWRPVKGILNGFNILRFGTPAGPPGSNPFNYPSLTDCFVVDVDNNNGLDHAMLCGWSNTAAIAPEPANVLVN